MLALLDPDQLPKWFRYPPGLLDLLKSESIDFGPWQILQGELLVIHRDGLKMRFQSFQAIPFARRFDDDDIASMFPSQPTTRGCE
jgi:hypothetical protein